jgi:hypothetical protein
MCRKHLSSSYFHITEIRKRALSVARTGGFWPFIQDETFSGRPHYSILWSVFTRKGLKFWWSCVCMERETEVSCVQHSEHHKVWIKVIPRVWGQVRILYCLLWLIHRQHTMHPVRWCFGRKWGFYNDNKDSNGAPYVIKTLGARPPFLQGQFLHFYRSYSRKVGQIRQTLRSRSQTKVKVTRSNLLVHTERICHNKN